MHDRKAELLAFAKAQGCETETLHQIAGDASNRAYFRAMRKGVPVVLMDAPPERGEDIRPFVQIATWLGDAGFSAPQIYATDAAQGFMLLEDLGDDLFANLMAAGAPEEELYRAAVDVLLRIAELPTPALARYDATTMAELAGLSVAWYRRGVKGADTPELRTELQDALFARLSELEPGPGCVILRDYHAQNLIWLPHRQGLARVGLLDFQDAMLGHPAYDLVSILLDARRDVPPELADSLLSHFIAEGGQDGGFRDAFHLLGLQRNLRILGVFARLWMRDGKTGYLERLPRVWAHVTRCLDQLGDTALRDLVFGILPPPDIEMLERIRTG